MVEVIKLLLNRISGKFFSLPHSRYYGVCGTTSKGNCGSVGDENCGRIAKLSGQILFVGCGFGDELIMGRRNRMKTYLLKLHR